MTDLTDVIDQPFPLPKRRISVSADCAAIIIPRILASELKSMCVQVRRGRRWSSQEKNAIQSICGDLLLALVETEYE